MKLFFQYILFLSCLSLFFSSSSLSQGRKSATVAVQIKIVKSSSVQIKESETSQIVSDESKINSSSVETRDLIVEYDNRTKILSQNKIIQKNTNSNLTIPQVSIFSGKSLQLAKLSYGNQKELRNMPNENNISFSYSKPAYDQIIYNDFSITIVY